MYLYLFLHLELQRKLPQNLKGSRDLAVIEALEKICVAKHFVTYTYSPPKTVKACKLLLGKFKPSYGKYFKYFNPYSSSLLFLIFSPF